MTPARIATRTALALAALLIASPAVRAEIAMADHAHHAMMEMDAHVHHHPDPTARTRRAVAAYTVPNVHLVREDGKAVSLPAEINDGRPVLLSFIYTTCTTICPITSQTLSQVQAVLSREHRPFHIMSISIDPEQDTPARLREYAHKFGAGPAWQHYTGSTAASIAAQRAFDVYRGDKMDHNQVVLMRAAPGKPWVRIEGFATPQEIEQEFSKLAVRQ